MSNKPLFSLIAIVAAVALCVPLAKPVYAQKTGVSHTSKRQSITIYLLGVTKTQSQPRSNDGFGSEPDDRPFPSVRPIGLKAGNIRLGSACEKSAAPGASYQPCAVPLMNTLSDCRGVVLARFF